MAGTRVDGPSAPVAPARPGPLRRALSSPNEASRLLAVAIAVDEGLEAHAHLLAAHVAEHPDDEVVLRAVARAVRSHPWRDEPGPWGQVLIGWAVSQPPAASNPGEMPAELSTDALDASDAGDLTGPRSGTTRLRAVARTGVDLALVAAATLVVGVRATAFTGFPKGADAFGHVSKIELLVGSFPHIQWNPFWYGGMPHFESSYPPVLHLLGATLVGVTGCSPAQAVGWIGAASVIVAAACLYGIATLVSRRRLAGLAAAALFLSSPNLWVQLTGLGAYARLLAFAFLALAVLFSVLHVLRPGRRWLIAASTALASTLATHLLVAVIACVMVAAVLVLAPAGRIRDRIWRAASVGLPAAGLTAFFYLPFLTLPRPKTGAATGTYAPPLRTLLWPSEDVRLDALPLLLLPSLVVAGLGAVLARRALAGSGSPRRALLRPRPGPSPRAADATARAGRLPLAALTSAVALGLVGGACVLFTLAGHAGIHIALYGINTWDVYVYASWALPVLVAGGVGLAIARWSRLEPLLLVVLVGSLLAAGTVARMAEAGANDAHVSVARLEAQALFPAEADGQSQYRVGATTDTAGDWVGALHATPIVRGYQNQGTVNVDWQFWVEQALWDKKLSPGERSARLDWYGVKWLYSDNIAAGVDEALDADPAFEVLGRSSVVPGLNLYRNARVTPIASATTAPTVLVIASRSGYPMVFRGLGPAGTASTSLIPVDGGSFVDDLDAEELARFPQVAVYEARAHDWDRAARLLLDYVEGGGRLFIEGAGMSGEEVEALRPLSPVIDTTQTVRSWGFTSSGGDLLDGVDRVAYDDPARADVVPWEVAGSEHLAPGGRVVLASGPAAVMAEIDRGAGHVVWSGLNLPFHVAAFESAPESFLLSRVLGAAPSPVTPSGAAVSVNAEHERVEAPPGASGVLFKQTASAAWRATVDGKAARIYSAGPGFMYVSLPHGGAHTVDLTYHPLPVDLAGAAVTVGTALLLVAYGLGIRPPAAVRRARSRWTRA